MICNMKYIHEMNNRIGLTVSFWAKKNPSRVTCLRKGSWMKLDLDRTTASKITMTSNKRD